MAKIIISEEQYKRLFSEKLNEASDVKGGINRVNNLFVKNTRTDIQNLSSESEKFNIRKPIPGLPNSGMKNDKPEKTFSESNNKAINEDIFSPEVHEAVRNLIENIWLNPSQRGLDRVFVENGITWGDIISYLTSVGVLAVTGMGLHRVTNFFKRKFSKDKEKAFKEKSEEIDKIADMVVKDPKAPWSKNRLKSETPPIKEDDMESKPKFGTITMNYEIAILNGPDGRYVFFYDDINRNDLHDPKYELHIEDITDYVNNNLDKITQGEGLKAWDSGALLVKIDEDLRQELLDLYKKNKDIVKVLQKLEEMTSAAGGSQGAFTGPIGGTGKTKLSSKVPSNEINKIINDEDEIYGKKIEEDLVKEITAAGGGEPTPVSSTTGQYVQPKIWAKNKANWAASKKTQYPNGEMVEFDPCTKLNNNKSAQNGKCSTGAVDNVVKLKRTKQSVISKTIYEKVAEKTGRKVEDVKKIIENKVSNKKSL